jgi:hypothetical protein
MAVYNIKASRDVKCGLREKYLSEIADSKYNFNFNQFLKLLVRVTVTAVN